MVTIIYVLVNLAYFAVVTRSELLASVAVAVVSRLIYIHFMVPSINYVTRRVRQGVRDISDSKGFPYRKREEGRKMSIFA